MSTPSQPKTDIAVITDASDIPAGVEVMWACFGVQVPDAIVEAMHPGWGTPDGYTRAVERMVKSFETATNRDKNGNPTKVFLKATTTDAAGNRRIAGFAVWLQLSMVDGFGEPSLPEAEEALAAEELYPDDETERQYFRTLLDSLHRQRTELTQQQSTASPPAIMALDLCVVHPDFQRRGIASTLVQYGLDEAKRRGGLVASTEASTMGRFAYAKLGFVQQGPEMEYGVNGARFARNGMPSNIFMRTN